jgi:dTDP-4-dehydrorhamnose 3,5-epimerase
MRGGVRFRPLELRGAYVIDLEPAVDERGSFARVWCREEFSKYGLDAELAQCSVSRNARIGTLRGLHFQEAPHEETKLVRCIRGAIFDVMVDLRRTSATAYAWVGVTLDAASGAAVYVPKGFAHGFQTLTDDAEVLYMISEPYTPAAASGVRWNDPAFGITWPEADDRTISARDQAWPLVTERSQARFGRRLHRH